MLRFDRLLGLRFYEWGLEPVTVLISVLEKKIHQPTLSVLFTNCYFDITPSAQNLVLLKDVECNSA